MKQKKRKEPKAAPGMSRAVVLSILIHAGLFLLAGTLVVFTVVKHKQVEFEPPKPVERPKMKLKKPKVRVKKSTKPKPTNRIVTKVKTADMPDIQLPEMSGVGEGLSGGLEGFDMMPNLADTSIFGGGQSIGNDFVGTFYDLKRDRTGRKIPMDADQFRQTLDRFIIGGWKESFLSRYYQAPKKLYTTHFVVPPIPSPTAPEAYGSPETESYYFFIKYKGQLVYPKDIKFRFWGIGDAYCMIRVGGKLVFIATWPFHDNRDGYFSMWRSSSPQERKYQLANQMMAVGDWIELKGGQPVDMEVLYGEWKGGQMGCILLVQVSGVDYPTSTQHGPLLPVFKTEEFTRDQLEEIGKYLPPGECNLTNGPVFRDFTPPPRKAEVAKSAAKTNSVASAPAKKRKKAPGQGGMRKWTLVDGRTVRAELVTCIGGKVTLKNKKGKSLQVPLKRLSRKDQKFVQMEMPPKLDIGFSKSSKQRIYPDTVSLAAPPRSSYFTFKVTVKKKSTRPYDQPLTAEYFAIGQEFSGATHRLLEYRKEAFVLDKENRNQVTFSGNPVEIVDYSCANGQRRGEKFEGYLVVVTDSRGEIIAHKASSELFFQNLENLRKVPVGKYFDDNGNRVAPSRPKPYPAPNAKWL